MNNSNRESESVVTPELREEAKQALRELMETPGIKRFWYLGERCRSGEATPEEREEYEARTAWIRNLPESPIPGLIPDDHPLSMGDFPSTKYQPRPLKKTPPADPGPGSP